MSSHYIVQQCYLGRHVQWTRDKMSSSVSKKERLSSAYVLSRMGVSLIETLAFHPLEAFWIRPATTNVSPSFACLQTMATSIALVKVGGFTSL